VNNKIKFETFLLINPKKIIISVNTLPEFQNIYEKEFKLENTLDQIDFEKLDYFLSQNIFKIEKTLNDFIKRINVVIDQKQFFFLELSIKKNNYENFVNRESLNYLLNEAKENCKKTIDERKIIHMIIKNYYIDNIKHSSFAESNKSGSLSLDLSFICLSNSFIKILEKNLKKYQISIDKIVCEDYVKNFLTNNEKNIFYMTKKILDGYNSNEVLLVNKKQKNEGFFEKFFNFFN